MKARLGLPLGMAAGMPPSLARWEACRHVVAGIFACQLTRLPSRGSELIWWYWQATCVMSLRRGRFSAAPRRGRPTARGGALFRTSELQDEDELSGTAGMPASLRGRPATTGREVLECACLLALSHWHDLRRRHGRLKSGRRLPQSKTLARGSWTLEVAKRLECDRFMALSGVGEAKPALRWN